MDNQSTSSSLPDDSTSFFEIDNDKDEIFITLKIEEYDQYIYIYIYIYILSKIAHKTLC